MEGEGEEGEYAGVDATDATDADEEAEGDGWEWGGGEQCEASEFHWLMIWRNVILAEVESVFSVGADSVLRRPRDDGLS